MMMEYSGTDVSITSSRRITRRSAKDTPGELSEVLSGCDELLLEVERLIGERMDVGHAGRDDA